MKTSFKTCLTPEEHFHMHGTLAPEQVAEFLEEYVAPGTVDRIEEILDDFPEIDTAVFDSVVSKVSGAYPYVYLLTNLRVLLQDTYLPGDGVLELLGRIESDTKATAAALASIKADVEALKQSTAKAAADQADKVQQIKTLLGV